MGEKAIIYIFHLTRNGGKPVFYHPFSATQEFIDQMKGSEIAGKYGEDPRVESITLLRNDLYRRAETAIKLWITDVRFIPRFLISSAVFLLMYFFMSYVVRDPIPLIDELLFAFGGAAVVYLLIGRRYLNSDAVVQKRIELRTVIDGISFTESEFMKKIEGALASYDKAPLGELLKIYGSQEKLALDPEWAAEARSFHHYLDAHFDTKAVKSFRRKLQNRVTIGTDNPLAKLRRLIDTNKIDFPLFLISIQLDRSLD